MIFEQYELGCLSLFSYLIGDEFTGRAVVIDPQRDVRQYLDDADVRGLRIERVIETHVHADFLSGHLELAAATGAVISYGPGATTDFPIEVLRDGQRLVLGDVVLEVRATPGHTPESISIVVFEHDGLDPFGVLTGDTLFIGDVGRPDLLAAAGQSAEELARLLFHSLRAKLLTLPDATRVFPAHGAGSACGKQMSSASSSTIGEQRRSNYALGLSDEESFAAAVLEGQGSPPPYFSFDAVANRRDRGLLDEAPPPILSLDEVLSSQARRAVLLDTRSADSFAASHVRGSLNVPLDGRYAEYAGSVVGPERDLVLVGDRGSEAEARIRLGRIGFDRVIGALPDPEHALTNRPDAAQSCRRLSPAEARSWWESEPSLQIVDVRNTSEHELGTIVGAMLVPLRELAARLAELSPDRPTLCYCASGQRSSIAASLLRASGYPDVADVRGGFDELVEGGLPVAGSAPVERC